ncbi:DUF5131 family protein [Thioclava sp. BHET1]|nr:DUF5131 family protein [Thioclava sp. BHET1]
MADKTSIEWTDATWNPITGCTLVSKGCRNCYAATLAAGRLRNHPSRIGLARRNAEGEARFTGEVRFNGQWLDQPIRWRRPRRIFVCAHGDLFHEGVPDNWIDEVFAVMALAPHHTFQILTKRPARARAYLNSGASLMRVRELAAERIGDDARQITFPLANVCSANANVTAPPSSSSNGVAGFRLSMTRRRIRAGSTRMSRRHPAAAG